MASDRIDPIVLDTVADFVEVSKSAGLDREQTVDLFQQICIDGEEQLRLGCNCKIGLVYSEANPYEYGFIHDPNCLLTLDPEIPHDV